VASPKKKPAKKKGLGKGLGALLGDATVQPAPAPAPSLAPGPAALEDGTTLLSLDPREIKPNPQQPRHQFDEDALEELADSIRHDGVQEPVLVRRNTAGDYELISGERRVRASVMADLATIPAICRDVSDRDLLRLGLIENIQREDLNPIETARAYQQLIDDFGWTQEELADQVGKKRATVANILRLRQLANPVQDLVAEGQLTLGHAKALLAIQAPDRQHAAARKIIENGLSVRQAEQLGARGPEKATSRKSDAPPSTTKDPHIAEIENSLRRTLGTKVTLRTADGAKGKIEIDYYNLDELERILTHLKGGR